jgi:simple sugar transport system permease protein
MTMVLGIAWFAQGGQTPAVSTAVRIQPLFPQLAESVKTLPLIGPVLGEGLFSHNFLVYLALALVPAVWWLMFRTRFGLRLRAVGENPQMVDAAGVSVTRLRYAALTLNGMLCGLAGSYLVLAQAANFSHNMTAGRGFMALAALIFGRWHPVLALWACLLFGFLDAAAIRLQGVKLPAYIGGGEVPVQAIQALPYVLTVVLLAGFIGSAVAPKALGRPYSKER